MNEQQIQIRLFQELYSHCSRWLPPVLLETYLIAINDPEEVL